MCCYIVTLSHFTVTIADSFWTADFSSSIGSIFLTPLSGNEIIIRAYSSSVSCDDNHRAGAVDSVYDFKDLPSLIFFRHRISNFRHFLHFAANLRSTIDIERTLNELTLKAAVP